MEPDDTCIRRDIERLNLASSSTSHGMSHIGYTADRWDVNRRPIKPRARSEYSHLDKLHCVPNNMWSVEQTADDCHDSGVSLPLAVSQASNLQYEGDQNLIDRSFGFLDQENYSPTYHGMRPQIFNCRSEPAIPPKLNMEALSQVRPGYHEKNTRPASIHISSQYSEHHIFNNQPMYHDNHPMYHDNQPMYHDQLPLYHDSHPMYHDNELYRSMESMLNNVKLGNTSDHTSDTTLSVPEEQHVQIDRDPNKGFGFTIRTASDRTVQDRVKIKEVKPDSPAASKGLIEGQILLQVNGKDIQELSFEEIVFLIHNEGNSVNLTVVPAPVNAPISSLNDVLHDGPLLRQTKCGGIKMWSKQWITVRRDGCLYYRKSRESVPSGMIVLPSFHCSSAVCANRKHVIKISRGSSVYLFAAQDSQEYEKWLEVLSEANKTQSLTLTHSKFNCALSALAIDNPLIADWIFKLKLSGFRSKRKWCVLKDNMMFFYYNMHDKKAHEVLCLTGYSCARTSVRDYKYCFALIPGKMKGCNSVLVFANDNKHAYDRWFEKIQSVLDSSQLVGPSSSSSSSNTPTTSPPLSTHPSSPAVSRRSPHHASQHAMQPRSPQLPRKSPALPRRSQPLLRRSSGGPTPDTQEYYRKKDIQNDSMYHFNTLVHTGDTRPRSWHHNE